MTQPYSRTMTPYVEKAQSSNNSIEVFYESGGSAYVKESQIQVKMINVTGFQGETS